MVSCMFGLKLLFSIFLYTENTPEHVSCSFFMDLMDILSC